MKCVCPMGGDRTCPDNCLVGAWHGLPDDQKTKMRRRPIVEVLAKQGYTQETIALQLGVSQPTVQRDLDGLFTVNKPHRPKGGRPKGSKRVNTRGRATPKLDKARAIVRAKLDANEPISPHKLEKECSGEISHVTFDMAITAELARREAKAEPDVDRADLSMSAQKKFDIAVKQMRRKLEAEIRQQLHAEYQKWLTDLISGYRKKEQHYNIIIKQHKGIMDKTSYNLIWSCLHADSRKSVSDDKLNRAFNLWTNLEKRVLSEKDSPTNYGDLPKTPEEWMKRKAAYQAERAAARAAKKNKSNGSVVAT